jgi:hypothetical protein
MVHSFSDADRMPVDAAKLLARLGRHRCVRNLRFSLSGRIRRVWRAARGCLDGSCPGNLPDNFHLELLDGRPQRGRALSGVARCVAIPDSNLATLFLPRDHVLTGALS